MVEVPNKLLDRARIELDTYWRLDKQTASELISTLFESERQIAELRAKVDVQRQSKEYAQRCCEKAEAENARLKALPLKDEVERVLDRAHQKIRTYVSVYPDDKELRLLLSDWRALLSRLRAGEQEGWREITEDDQPPLDTDVIMGCWETLPKRHWATEIGHYGSKRGGWIHGRMTHWLPLDRLPASPSEQGGDRG